MMYVLTSSEHQHDQTRKNTYFAAFCLVVYFDTGPFARLLLKRLKFVKLNKKVFSYASWSLIATQITVTMIAYGILPDQIPVHFDGTGSPDRWGERSLILILLGINVILFLLVTGTIMLYEKLKPASEAWILYFIRLLVPLYGIAGILETYVQVVLNLNSRISEIMLIVVLNFATIVYIRRLFIKPK